MQVYTKLFNNELEVFLKLSDHAHSSSVLISRVLQHSTADLCTYCDPYKYLVCGFAASVIIIFTQYALVIALLLSTYMI